MESSKRATHHLFLEFCGPFPNRWEQISFRSAEAEGERLTIQDFPVNPQVTSKSLVSFRFELIALHRASNREFIFSTIPFKLGFEGVLVSLGHDPSKTVAPENG